MSEASGGRSYDLTYRLSADDYVAMMDLYWSMTRGRRLWVLFLQLIVFVAGIKEAITWWTYGEWLDGAAALLLLSAPLSVPLINRRAYKRSFEKQRLGEGDVRLTADSEAARFKWVVADFSVPWRNVERVDSAGGRTFIWISGAQAMIVPRGAFASDADAGNFATWARERFSAAQCGAS